MKLIKIYRVIGSSLNDYITLFKEINIVKMKKLFYFIIVLFVASSCASSGAGGELMGVLGRPVWYQTDPYGMLYIPAGAFNMGD